jgi:hypothetical protein
MMGFFSSNFDVAAFPDTARRECVTRISLPQYEFL